MKDNYLFHPCEVGFVGFSNSGKTTLITRLIERNAKKYSIAYIKHDAHRFTMDREGKDTHRAWESGAEKVFISDSEHCALLSKKELDPRHLRLHFEDCDMAFVEGRKNSIMRKIVMIDEGRDILDLLAEGMIRNVVAFSGKEHNPQGLPEGVPYFHRDDLEGITEFIERNFLVLC